MLKGNRMRLSTCLVLIIAIIAVTGCASVKVSQDYYPETDWSPYTTWQWRHSVQPRSGDIRIEQSIIRNNIGGSWHILPGIAMHDDTRRYVDDESILE